jgi:hypothetical protein
VMDGDVRVVSRVEGGCVRLGPWFHACGGLVVWGVACCMERVAGLLYGTRVRLGVLCGIACDSDPMSRFCV